MDERPFETINVLPFVDIMLVLLAMVLTTANFITTGHIPVALPQVSQTQGDKQKNTVIELSATVEAYFDGKPLLKDGLESALRGLPLETSILIRADRAVSFQSFIDIADALRRLKFTKVAVETQNASR